MLGVCLPNPYGGPHMKNWQASSPGGQRLCGAVELHYMPREGGVVVQKTDWKEGGRYYWCRRVALPKAKYIPDSVTEQTDRRFISSGGKMPNSIAKIYSRSCRWPLCSAIFVKGESETTALCSPPLNS
jgi:hypothetical protein